jgi:hypothetical protein
LNQEWQLLSQRIRKKTTMLANVHPGCTFSLFSGRMKIRNQIYYHINRNVA